MARVYSKFSLRRLLALILVIALGLGWWQTRQENLELKTDFEEIARLYEELELVRNRYHQLNLEILHYHRLVNTKRQVALNVRKSRLIASQRAAEIELEIHCVINGQDANPMTNRVILHRHLKLLGNDIYDLKIALAKLKTETQPSKKHVSWLEKELAYYIAQKENYEQQ